MTNAKVRIDVPAGIVELEGNETFVTTHLDKLLPFIEAGGFGMGMSQEAPAPENKSAEPDNKKTSRKRRVPKRPPPGTSCRERILELRADGFFKGKQHSPSDIVNGLASKGWTYKNNQVNAALTTMFSKGEIQRTKDWKSFKYFYDRDK